MRACVGGGFCRGTIRTHTRIEKEIKERGFAKEERVVFVTSYDEKWFFLYPDMPMVNVL